MDNKELRQCQKDINERLANCWYENVDAADFDALFGSHSENLMSIVDRNGILELWKGDTQIGGSGRNRAILAAKDPNGWDFVMNFTSQYGSGEGSVDFFDSIYGNTAKQQKYQLSTVPTIIPVNGVKKYRGLFFAGLNKPTTTANVSDGHAQSINGADLPEEAKTMYKTRVNRSTYVQISFYILRKKGISEQATSLTRERLTYTIHPGLIMPFIEAPEYSTTSASARVLYLSDRYQFAVNPMVYCERYTYSDGKTTTGRYFVLPEDREIGNITSPKPQYTSFLTSEHESVVNRLHYQFPDETWNPALTHMGLILLFFKDTLLVDKGSWPKNSDNVPSLGINITRAYWSGDAWALAESQRDIQVLHETDEPWRRLGLERDLVTGEQLSDYVIADVTENNKYAYDIYKSK
jgi:hypothetical protein